MKKNVIIAVGIIVAIAVLLGIGLFIKDRNHRNSVVRNSISDIAMKSFSGEALQEFEGNQNLRYIFDIPETASTSVSMEGSLIKVTDADMPVITMYMSYEGGRGYNPLDYLTDVIAPHVSVVDVVGTSTFGNYDWLVAESEGSEWHIAPVASSSWLVVVQNKKSSHAIIEKVLNSFSTR